MRVSHANFGESGLISDISLFKTQRIEIERKLVLNRTFSTCQLMKYYTTLNLNTRIVSRVACEVLLIIYMDSNFCKVMRIRLKNIYCYFLIEPG